MVPTPPSRAHHLRPMTGRDQDETHRTATPLELLFDLTFVVAFGVAAEQLAHLLAEGHLGSGLIGFGFATFSICWAWINYSWFASAYDTDDWAFRLATMTQMVGVAVLALGLPQMFHSLDHDTILDNGTMVAGYVVMRVAMIFLWLRAARDHPARRDTCRTYAATIALAQIGWIALIFAQTSVWTFLTWTLVLAAIEFGGPVVAERRFGQTPWHAGHIAERYGLMAIITLGEGVIGTVASLNVVVETQGWSRDAVLVAVAGIGLTFGMWWTYFMTPAAEVLQVHRRRAFVWGYGNMAIFGSIAATGAGLHVAAYFIEGESHLGATATVLSVAVPLAAFVFALYGLYTYLVHAGDPFHIGLLAGTVAVLVLAVWLATLGMPMAVCLVVVMLAPLVTVIGYETIGHRHQAAVLERALAHSSQPTHNG